MSAFKKILTFGENTFGDFANFLGQQNIIGLAIATAIGLYINTFITELMNVVGVPIINKILGKKTTDDKYEVIIFGIKFDVSKLIEIILKLLVTLIIIYLVFSKLPNLVTGLIPINASNTPVVSTTTAAIANQSQAAK